jgi:hypothetical protein
MRTQPIHEGHTRIVQRMINNHDVVILGCGSANKPVSIQNPFPVEVRMEMWDRIYGLRVKLVPLADLGATKDTNEWCDYVLKKVRGVGLPDPTDYYTGSPADAIWYRGRFFNKECGSPADDQPDDFIQRYMPNNVFRQLHLEERTHNYIPSATELRQFMVTRDDGWKRWVPAVIHDLVEKHFPEEFKVEHGDG